MALTSPGVQVTVIDESFYTPAEPGTTPLIVVATAQNKVNSAGTGTATATTQANAGKAFKLTSQKDLLDLFGVPFFEKTASASPIHGGERNEYGLLAAYSLLGVSNAAFIVRADVDLNQLEGSTDIPGANPSNGAWWVDTQASAFGIQEWNGAAISTTGGQKFAAKNPTILTDSDTAKLTAVGGAPKDSVGSIGDYVVVFETVTGNGSFTAGAETARVYYKSAGNTQAGVAAGQWVVVGSQEWTASHPTVVGGTISVSTLTAGNFLINGTLVTISNGHTLTNLVATINGLNITGVTAKALNSKLYLYSNGATETTGDSTLANAITIAPGTASLTELGLETKVYYGPALQQTPHTQVPEWKSTDTSSRPTGSVWIKTTEPNNGARWRVKKWNAASDTWVSYEAPIYATTNAALYYLDRSGGGANLSVDTLVVQSNSDEHADYDTTPATATFRMWRRISTGNTIITSTAITSTVAAGAKTFTIAESLKGQIALDAAKTISFTALGTSADANLIAGKINAAGFTNIEAAVTSSNEVQIYHKLGGDFRLVDGTGSPVSAMFTAYNLDTGAGTDNFYSLPATTPNGYLASNFRPFAVDEFTASGDAPTNEPADGQLWFTPDYSDVDVMIHNGTTWVGYQNYNAAYANTDSNGPQVTATAPTLQSDGTALVDGDLWISTADLENFPTIYRWNGSTLEWSQLDKTDQVTEEGVLFADARWGNAGNVKPTALTAIKDLLTSNFLDFDAPDPALYPKGMLLWNLRRSGGNVKQYRNNYIDTAADNGRLGDVSMSTYATDRWTTASANNEDGSGSFGRKAQRKVVVSALKSVVDTSQEIRDEERRNFNLISAPGYPEVLQNLVGLNIDRGLTAFVVGDTPLRLPSDATSLTNWGTNANLVTDNGDDGIVTYDEYMAVFYPNGFTTDLGGTNAVVPASHMMLKTIALSDNVSYPWFAPAGTRRGGITNATSVGYIDALSGEFQTVALNNGQRDTLYDLKVNPITFFNGIGHVNYGQKTRARNASALDRINVARLVVYLRSQLNKLARPYVFEPNDKITRDEIKQAVESLLLELVGLRALYDFAVVCDETNNTPSRVDRNELYVDIAIEPVKAIEFVYIPLRVKNTGEI